MTAVLISVLATLRGMVRERTALHLEILALRHQLEVLQRSKPRRVCLATSDRWLWAWLSRAWSEWRMALVIVKPECPDLRDELFSRHKRGGAALRADRNKKGTIRDTFAGKRMRSVTICSVNLEAPPGFEPGVEVLQFGRSVFTHPRHSSDFAFS
jgi:hypothetical protein